MTIPIGELAALSVALLWSCGSLLFTWAARQVGVVTTNSTRITLAALLLAALHLARLGTPFPRDVAAGQLGLLAVSGLVGLVIGDACYFRALVLVGPRRASVLFSLSPAMTVLLGWLLLQETLGWRALAGIALTLSGTAWVVLERAPSGGRAPHTLLGTLCGLGAAAGQSVGLVLAKAAMGGMDALSATLVRMLAAAAVSCLVLVAGGRSRRVWADLRRPRVLAVLGLAASIGPVLGVWLSLIAIQHTETAVAATLMALVPVMIIPLAAVTYKERPSFGSVAGAVVAVAGVAVLLARKTPG